MQQSPVLALQVPVSMSRNSESPFGQHEEQAMISGFHFASQQVLQSSMLPRILPLTPLFKQRIDLGVGR
jgi:hypothetical protein